MSSSSTMRPSSWMTNRSQLVPLGTRTKYRPSPANAGRTRTNAARETGRAAREARGAAGAQRRRRPRRAARAGGPGARTVVAGVQADAAEGERRDQRLLHRRRLGGSVQKHRGGTKGSARPRRAGSLQASRAAQREPRPARRRATAAAAGRGGGGRRATVVRTRGSSRMPFSMASCSTTFF
jgi:hypothetical protein